MSRKFLLSFTSNRKVKCKNARACGKFSAANYTCMHGGGSYCGIYRTLQEKKAERSTEKAALLTTA